MRVILEVEPDVYEAALDLPFHAGFVTELEIRQRDGLLSETRRVRRVEGLGSNAAKLNHGLEGIGPVILVHCEGEER